MIETLSVVSPFVRVKEGETKEGKKWKIVIIEEGKSLNNTVYTRDVLVEAVPLFENVKVYAYKFAGNFYDHIIQAQEIPQGYTGNLIGIIHNPQYQEIIDVEGNIKEGIVGDLNVFAEEYRKLFKNIWEEGEMDAIGFSVVIEAETEKDRNGNILVRKIDRVESVDVVSSPSAGGRLLKLLESQKGEKTMEKEKIIDAIKKINPEILEGVNTEEITDEELENLLLEAIEKKEPEKKEKEKEEDKEEKEAGGDIRLTLDRIKTLVKDKKIDEALMMIDDLIKRLGYGYGYGYPTPAEEGKEGKELKDLIDEVNTIRSSLTLEKKLNESNLPEVIRDKIKTFFKDKTFDEKEIDNFIKQEKETLGKLQESFGFQIGGQDKVKVMREDIDKKETALYNTLWGWNDLQGEDRKLHESVGKYRSFREAYIDLTGDVNIEFRQLTESTHSTALMADFPKLLENVINKRLAKEYPRLAVDTWRKLVSVVPLSDFNPQSIVRLGSIPELATVAEGAEYQSWVFDNTNKGYEEKADYTPGKKGGTYELSREMIKSDRIKGLVKLPDMIIRAANRTLMRYVFDLLINYGGGAINGGVIYDNKALYHEDHGNILDKPLNFDSLTEAKILLFNQTLPAITNDSSVPAEPLGLQAKYLIVPKELEGPAGILLKTEQIPGAANYGYNIHQGTFEIVVSPYLRDVDNWYLMADPAEMDTIEIGFVDGKDVPEVMVQDNPLVGKGFTHDVITYKIRLEFGGAIADWRPFVGSIVT